MKLCTRKKKNKFLMLKILRDWEKRGEDLFPLDPGEFNDTTKRNLLTCLRWIAVYFELEKHIDCFRCQTYYNSAKNTINLTRVLWILYSNPHINISSGAASWETTTGLKRETERDMEKFWEWKHTHIRTVRCGSKNWKTSQFAFGSCRSKMCFWNAMIGEKVSKKFA